MIGNTLDDFHAKRLNLLVNFNDSLEKVLNSLCLRVVNLTSSPF